MQRTKPTRNLLIEICAGDNPNYQGLIASAHHGLADCSLHDLYPFLDFDETIAFAASSRKSREKKERDFMKFLEGENLYNLFSHAYNIWIPWLRKNKRVSDENQSLYSKLNPYNGRNLRDRLSRVNSTCFSNLKRDLSTEPNEYIFECQYRDKKIEREGDNFGLVVMNFQNFYPKRDKIVPAFAAEIVRIISYYPKNLIDLEKTSNSPSRPIQGTLF